MAMKIYHRKPHLILGRFHSNRDCSECNVSVNFRLTLKNLLSGLSWVPEGAQKIAR
jgi:hypothetical protein